MSWRRTADVDFAVALTVDALPALASRPGWSRHPRREHEFYAPGGAKVDLTPASPQLIRAGRLEWRNRDFMSLVGMDPPRPKAAYPTSLLIKGPVMTAVRARNHDLALTNSQLAPCHPLSRAATHSRRR